MVVLVDVLAPAGLAVLEHVGQPADLVDRAVLGDRDQERILVFGVVAAERVDLEARRRSVGLVTEWQEFLDRPFGANREFPDHRRIVEQFESVEAADQVARVGGATGHQLAQFDEALLAQPGEVDHAGEGVQGLRSADVRGRLFPADVLLAGLKGEHETAAAVNVGRLTGDPTGHLAQVLLLGAEEAE